MAGSQVRRVRGARSAEALRIFEATAGFSSFCVKKVSDDPITVLTNDGPLPLSPLALRIRHSHHLHPCNFDDTDDKYVMKE